MIRRLGRLLTALVLLTVPVFTYGYCTYNCRYAIDDVYCGLGMDMTSCDTVGQCGWVCGREGCMELCDEQCVGDRCYRV